MERARRITTPDHRPGQAVRNQRAVLTATVGAIAVSALMVLPVSRAAQQGGPLQEGVRHFEAGRYTQARSTFEALVRDDRRNHAAAYWLGRTCLMTGEFKDAVDALESAVELRDTDVEYQRRRVEAYEKWGEDAGPVRAMGLARKWVQGLYRIIELDPAAVREREQLVGFYTSAPKLFGGGDIEKAGQFARELQALDDKRGRLAFIQIYEHEEQYNRVESEYRALLEQYSEDLEIPQELGLFYHDRERYEEAVATFLTLTERFPDYLYGWYLVGRSAAVSGRQLDTGIRCMEHYLQNESPEGSPSHAAAHWRLGMVFEHKNDLNRARQEYEASLRLEPDYQNAKDALRRIRP
ncbi:tetratricopeptide repeat protein [Gemmatimonadota bacterium]